MVHLLTAQEKATTLLDLKDICQTLDDVVMRTDRGLFHTAAYQLRQKVIDLAELIAASQEAK